MAKETILSLEVNVTGLPRDALEGKWVLGGGIEMLCTYKVYRRIDQKSYPRKRLKGLNKIYYTLWKYKQKGI